VNQAVERRADLALARASENHGAGEKAVENEGTLTDDDTTAGDDSIAGSGTTADDNTGANDDTLDGVVPSETALDAAVPFRQSDSERTGRERRPRRQSTPAKRTAIERTTRGAPARWIGSVTHCKRLRTVRTSQ